MALAFAFSPGIAWYMVDAAYELHTPIRYRMRLKVVIQQSDRFPFTRKNMHTARLMMSPSPWDVLLRISSDKEYVYFRIIVKEYLFASVRMTPLVSESPKAVTFVIFSVLFVVR